MDGRQVKEDTEQKARYEMEMKPQRITHNILAAEELRCQRAAQGLKGTDKFIIVQEI